MTVVNYGIGTNFDWRGNTIDDEPLLMEGFPLFESGSVSDTWEITMVKMYQIFAEDFIALCLFQPKKGQTVRIGLDGYIAWFQVDSVNVEREGSPFLRGSSTLIHVRVRVQLSLITSEESGESQQYTYPWDLPPYNFKLGTELLQQSAWDFFCTESADSANWSRVPFVNTAGVPLQAEVTRPLVRMSFSFNLYDIDPNWVHIWTGKVNNDEVTICGIKFQPGMVKLESLSFEVCNDTIPSEQENAEPEEIYYYKCDVSLLIDPQKFERKYLNVGVHIRDNNGKLRRLWTANNNGTIEFGSIDSVIGYSNPEEVTDNMFLNAAGTDVSGIDSNTQRQTPTYRIGYLEETCPFSAENGGIGLPTEPPFYQTVTPRPEEAEE